MSVSSLLGVASPEFKKKNIGFKERTKKGEDGDAGARTLGVLLSETLGLSGSKAVGLEVGAPVGDKIGVRVVRTVDGCLA